MPYVMYYDVYYYIRLTKVIEGIQKKPLPTHSKFVELEVCASNDADEDIELPTVRYRFRK